MTTKKKPCTLEWWECKGWKPEYRVEHDGRLFSLQERTPGEWKLTLHHDLGYEVRKGLFKVNDSRTAQALACKVIKK